MSDPLDRVRALVRVRQTRAFTAEPVDPDDLRALTTVARWSGSASNAQPWRFITLQNVSTIRRIAELGLPQTRGLATAMAAVAIVLPDEPDREVSLAYDEGRVAERLLIGASLLGLAAGISWITRAHRQEVGAVLGLPPGRTVRTIVGLGLPTEAARQPRTAPGQARLPLDELVFPERWPGPEESA
jgi:nitroreductase